MAYKIIDKFCCDCEIRLSDYRCIRCHSCDRKNRNLNRPKKEKEVKPRRKLGICIDCGTAICRKKYSRCRKCASVKQRKDPNIDVKTYKRNWRLKKNYNMTPDDFDGFWMAQRGKCYICRKLMKIPESRRGQSLDVVAVDHDHKTGQIRALLCNACNKGLGLFQDNIELLRAAIDYLEVGDAKTISDNSGN